jgi:hypothetical protein
MSKVIVIDDGYRHVAKVSSPGPLLAIGTTRLKWYDVARADTPAPKAVHDMARDYFGRTLTLADEVGFAVLHRCGAANDFYFLCACTWRNSNELWESVFYKDAAAADFAPFVQQGPHRGTYCVWELGPVIHEQQAWVRYLRSTRGEGDLRDYLGSTFEGSVA